MSQQPERKPVDVEELKESLANLRFSVSEFQDSIGEYLEVGFKNLEAGQPFTLQGYEVYWRPRRLVRRGA